jgi:uncharacterized protein YdiU (UPF0061 family)
LLTLDNPFARELPGLCIDCPPARFARPEPVLVNAELAAELGWDADAFAADLQQWLVQGGEGVRPVAQAYAGHQFGSFVPTLGDGRALLLGERTDIHGRRRDIALKGSGRTPFARGGDGKAALGPMLREYLFGEALHGLGIPTTRVLAVVSTGETVLRDGGPLPGALLVRVAASHLRVGSFQYLAARGDYALMQDLLRHTLARHYPQSLDRPDGALALLEEVVRAQAQLLAMWMHAGFLHGVMNTDNTTLSGETIDFGPCAWVERYDPATVFSSIDHAGRYAFGRQPDIARWNLARLAETLLPLMEAGGSTAEAAMDQANAALQGFPGGYREGYLQRARGRMGLVGERDGDAQLVDDFLALLHTSGADHTLAWRSLAGMAQDQDASWLALGIEPTAAAAWLGKWRARYSVAGGDPAVRARAMQGLSAIHVPRNQAVELALDSAVQSGDLQPVLQMVEAVRSPYGESSTWAVLSAPSPGAFDRTYRTFCGT